ncbi:hypothetical protein BYT27DRAFT_7132308 [Phlegmacium glaucopus]|nr:hypothetical protein BYT27DRAFT_7132308 [Phlegmacium glaucopus]
MLLWPWIFFSQARDGIQMPDNLAIYVHAHPHITNFFITFISTLINMIVAYLFSTAVIRFAQEWITKNHLNLFGLTLISGFSSQKIPWGPKDISYVCKKKSRTLRATLIILCWAAFTFGTSGITSLLEPDPFDKKSQLNGTELDFSTNDTACLNYLRSNPNDIGGSLCTWTRYRDFPYTTCLAANQLVDVLESGRGNILSMIQNDHPLTIDYSQLSGLQFLGSIRGVLPMGPNGVPAFNTVQVSPPLSNTSYSYTLFQQGLNISVSCKYDTQSPINTFNVSSGLISYNATCGGQTVALTNGTTYEVDEFQNTLAFWACKSPPNGTEALSYSLYLRGNSAYDPSVGNMTCTVSQAQSAIFPVTYNSTKGFFSTQESSGGVAPTFPDFIDRAVEGLSDLMQESQGVVSNEVADSIQTFGAKYFGLDFNFQQPDLVNLRLYELMIQGVLEYLATYSRLLYAAGAPTSCNRNVTGNGTYTVFGWFTGSDNIGLLMPLTIINFTSFVIMILAIIRTTHGSYQSDPTEPMALALAEHHHADEPQGWKDRVIFRDRQSNAPQ